MYPELPKVILPSVTPNDILRSGCQFGCFLLVGIILLSFVIDTSIREEVLKQGTGAVLAVLIFAIPFALLTAGIYRLQARVHKYKRKARIKRVYKWVNYGLSRRWKSYPYLIVYKMEDTGILSVEVIPTIRGTLSKRNFHLYFYPATLVVSTNNSSHSSINYCLRITVQLDVKHKILKDNFLFIQPVHVPNIWKTSQIEKYTNKQLEFLPRRGIYTGWRIQSDPERLAYSIYNDLYMHKLEYSLKKRVWAIRVQGNDVTFFTYFDTFPKIEKTEWIIPIVVDLLSKIANSAETFDEHLFIDTKL